MAKNECGREVPSSVGELAKQHGCVGGVQYVYWDGDYGGKWPAASIGCAKAARFRSNRFEAWKVVLADGWVAFRSPSKGSPGKSKDRPVPGITPPLYSRIGEVTETNKVDGSPLVFRVEDDELFIAPSNPKKAFCLQKILVDDGTGVENGHIEFRILYYMMIHKDRGKGKWGYGQYAPMMTAEELALIMTKMKNKGWLP